MLRWYLIHTKPSGEGLAHLNLQRQGYEVYLPRALRCARRRDRWRDCITPLFPRYLFLRLHEGRQCLAPVRSSLGVTNIVRFGLSYAIVPDAIVQHLYARADPQTGLHRLAGRPAFVAGTPVYIATGAFQGFDAVFERHAGPERVLVLLNLLGQDARVRVPTDFVLPGRAA
jgi:transcriptional antiterminator RfaH